MPRKHQQQKAVPSSVVASVSSGWGEEKTLSELVDAIRTASDAYYNGEPVMDDDAFDSLVEELSRRAPAHPLVTGEEVGAPLPEVQANASYMRAVDLPYVMGSLDKVKDVTSLTKWAASRPSDEYVVSDKLDGVSALLMVESNGRAGNGRRGGRTVLYTRGDGFRGRNVSHLVTALDLDTVADAMASHPLPKDSKESKRRDRQFAAAASDGQDGRTVALRGELIIPREEYKKHLESRGPARNLVSGVVNAKRPDLKVLRHVRFVPYEVMAPEGLPPRAQLSFLVSLYASLNASPKTPRHEVVHHAFIEPSSMTVDHLSTLLDERREKSKFEVDGIVIAQSRVSPPSSSSGSLLSKPNGSSNPGLLPARRRLNPDHMIAFKSRQADNIADVRVSSVEWNVSKDGLLKPVVRFSQSVRLGGAEVRQATGFNAAYINDHVLGPGSVVRVTRSGDVIPHIVEVLCPSESGAPQLPDPSVWDWEWTPSRVEARAKLDAVSSSAERSHATEELQIRLLTHFLKELGVKGVSEAAVRKLHWSKIDTPGKLMHASFDTLEKVPGFGKGTTDLVWSEMRRVAPIDKRTGLAVVDDCIKLMKASNAFGAGFGTQRLKAILATDPGAKVAGMMFMVTDDDSNRNDGNKRSGKKGDNDIGFDLEELPNAHEIAEATPGVHDTTASAFLEGATRFNEFLIDNRVKCSTESLPSPGDKDDKKANDTDLVIVFSGFRDGALQSRIEENGGRLSGSVSKNTTAVVVPDRDIGKETTKTKVAEANDVPVMSVTEFLEFFEENYGQQ